MNQINYTIIPNLAIQALTKFLSGLIACRMPFIYTSKNICLLECMAIYWIIVYTNANIWDNFIEKR